MPNPLTSLAVRIGAIGWLPRFLRQITAVDKALQRVSRGRVTLLGLAGLPNLLLTVPGRRTGVDRSTPLLCAPDGAGYLVAGSNFGGPREPIWVKNLEASMRGTLRVGGVTHPFTARALEDAERSEAWQRLLDVWPNFALYERRTERTIKVFALAPTD